MFQLLDILNVVYLRPECIEYEDFFTDVNELKIVELKRHNYNHLLKHIYDQHEDNCIILLVVTVVLSSVPFNYTGIL